MNAALLTWLLVAAPSLDLEVKGLGTEDARRLEAVIRAAQGSPPTTVPLRVRILGGATRALILIETIPGPGEPPKQREEYVELPLPPELPSLETAIRELSRRRDAPPTLAPGPPSLASVVEVRPEDAEAPPSVVFPVVLATTGLVALGLSVGLGVHANALRNELSGGFLVDERFHALDGERSRTAGAATVLALSAGLCLVGAIVHLSLSD